MPPRMRSAPAPPSITSFPLPPIRVSVPAMPESESLPPPPSSVSLPEFQPGCRCPHSEAASTGWRSRRRSKRLSPQTQSIRWHCCYQCTRRRIHTRNGDDLIVEIRISRSVSLRKSWTLTGAMPAPKMTRSAPPESVMVSMPSPTENRIAVIAERTSSSERRCQRHRCKISLPPAPTKYRFRPRRPECSIVGCR